MISRDSTIDDIKDLVRECLMELYDKDDSILRRNRGKGICERSIVFRFAHYLQNCIDNENNGDDNKYWVDCDFNSSFENDFDNVRGAWGREREGKPLENEDGSTTKRFVDIIVHRRDFQRQNDLICFEIKKWNYTKADDIKKDRNNLRVLTSQYEYLYGFHIIIHPNWRDTEWTIFYDGRPISEEKIF